MRLEMYTSLFPFGTHSRHVLARGPVGDPTAKRSTWLWSGMKLVHSPARGDVRGGADDDPGRSDDRDCPGCVHPSGVALPWKGNLLDGEATIFYLREQP